MKTLDWLLPWRACQKIAECEAENRRLSERLEAIEKEHEKSRRGNGALINFVMRSARVDVDAPKDSIRDILQRPVTRTK